MAALEQFTAQEMPSVERNRRFSEYFYILVEYGPAG
jgi:hypothetical protein